MYEATRTLPVAPAFESLTLPIETSLGPGLGEGWRKGGDGPHSVRATAVGPAHCDGHDYLVLSPAMERRPYRVCRENGLLPNGWLRSNTTTTRSRSFGENLDFPARRRQSGLMAQRSKRMFHRTATKTLILPTKFRKHMVSVQSSCFPVAPILFCDTGGSGDPYFTERRKDGK